MITENQKLYLGLYRVEDRYYKEITFPEYKRAEFGEIGWVVHPQTWGVINQNNIIFEKPVDSDWGVICALSLFISPEGSGMVSVFPIDPIQAGAGNAVVIERGEIFIPIKSLEAAEVRVNSYTIH